MESLQRCYLHTYKKKPLVVWYQTSVNCWSVVKLRNSFTVDILSFVPLTGKEEFKVEVFDMTKNEIKYIDKLVIVAFKPILNTMNLHEVAKIEKDSLLISLCSYFSYLENEISC